MKLKLPYSSYNWISLIGATIAVISLFMIIFLFVISFLSTTSGSYLGLVVYIILPAFLVLGLVLIPVGMAVKVRRDKRKHVEAQKKWPIVNLNDIRHRNAFMIFAVGTTVFLFLSALGSYEAFNFTESNEFCGQICHTVMKPEFTAYQSSPHARVNCVDCHVGEGADWYVRSKLSGLYQVYAVTFNVYPKPIPTPITNLRPARETCERCHWPEKFYARQLRVEKHFLPDEENSEWDIYMQMKIGAAYSALGLQEGIHWHINPNVKIEYMASDESREEIPWVKYTNKKTGEVKIFKDEDNELDQAAMDTLETRTMDCIDCHNRPSHNYRPPTFFVNNAMVANIIPKDLPEIKSLAMDIMGEEFGTTDSAMQYINDEVVSYYQDNYPDIFKNQKGKVEQAITGLQQEFKKNIFPEMKAQWNAYPNHIGHMEFNGCFRCHNDRHSTESGEVITKNCNLCHTITAQGPPDDLQVAKINEALEFKHPVDIGEAWKDFACIECHTGLNP